MNKPTRILGSTPIKPHPASPAAENRYADANRLFDAAKTHVDQPPAVEPAGQPG